MSWLVEHWGILTALMVLVTNIFNALTPHFDQYKGLKKALMIVADLLSVLASRDSYRTWKLPFTIDKRES